MPFPTGKRNMKDITGNRYGRLVVIKHDDDSPIGIAKWICQCDCGNVVSVKTGALKSGNTKSCGCLHRENFGEMSRKMKAGTKHGGSHKRIYGVWKCIKRRTTDPNYKQYKDYAGRGITICDEWRDDFAAFRDWAYANGYDENAPRGKCTIDRIDNDKGYSPENCRFVDMAVQRMNQRPRKKKGA